MANLGFDVMDLRTGQVVRSSELSLIAEEPWASSLYAGELDGFALCEDGSLILTDTCGGYAIPPSGRFSLTVEAAVVIRCKDCRNYVETTYDGEIVACACFCSRTNLYTVPEAYCFWAEKRKEEGED